MLSIQFQSPSSAEHIRITVTVKTTGRASDSRARHRAHQLRPRRATTTLTPHTAVALSHTHTYSYTHTHSVTHTHYTLLALTCTVRVSLDSLKSWDFKSEVKMWVGVFKFIDVLDKNKQQQQQKTREKRLRWPNRTDWPWGRRRLNFVFFVQDWVFVAGTIPMLIPSGAPPEWLASAQSQLRATRMTRFSTKSVESDQNDSLQH